MRRGMRRRRVRQTRCGRKGVEQEKESNKEEDEDEEENETSRGEVGRPRG